MKVIILLLSLLSFSCSALPKPYAPPKDIPFIFFAYSCDNQIGFAGQFQGIPFDINNLKQYYVFKKYVEAGGAYISNHATFDPYYGKKCGVET